MSDARQHAQTNDAKEIQTRAADWLMERYESASWNEESAAALEAWLSQSLAHRVAYVRLETAWNRTDRLVAMRKPASDETAAPPRRITPMFFKIAAMLIAVAVLGAAAAGYILSPREQVFATAMGAHRTVKLADGSQIELNTDTFVRVKMTEAQRTVWLDRGEAYFQVKHDPKHPFILMAGNQRVTDLGTKFLVRRETGRLEVDVIQGSVRFETAVNDSAQTRSALLMPGNIAVATEQSIVVTRKPSQILADRLGWRRGVLVFDHTTLDDAVADFNRYSRQKLVVADSGVARLTIDGTFPTNDVELFARVARDILGLRIENRKEEIVIAR
jgi:transmembrane sensor